MEQAKQKIDKIEELKWGSKAVKMLQDLKYENNNKIAEILNVKNTN